MRSKWTSVAAVCVGSLLASSNIYAAGPGRNTDYVYVETNIKSPNGNSIAAFKRAQDGHLSAIAGSPFLADGSGVQFTGINAGPPDSNQDIITNLDHSLLFAVNSGSDTIAVFHIRQNGSLEPIKGSPFLRAGLTRRVWRWSACFEQT